MPRRTLQLEAALSGRVERLERLRYEGHTLAPDGQLVLAIFSDAARDQLLELRPGDTIGQAVNQMDETRKKKAVHGVD